VTDPEDVLKKAGSFFTKLGSTMKSTAKHVTGIGRGDVRLELDAPKAAPGGTLRGRIVLQLAEPTGARRLAVLLRATRRQRQSGQANPVTQELYKFDLELAGAQSYDSTTVPFELTVPPDALELKPTSSHPLVDALRVLSPTGPIEWQVIGRLEIPWGRDLTSSVDVVISR